ncbi:unnamed protein product [Prorocentrum cordatum]|uniref:Uncharacterized protein n=1 Tax=Prorocentrum cordatum TaxID=2364126 RepID=A0ABN9ULC0_9DINO|nr:unnamed protein product [Polarella glacialis]
MLCSFLADPGSHVLLKGALLAFGSDCLPRRPPRSYLLEHLGVLRGIFPSTEAALGPRPVLRRPGGDTPDLTLLADFLGLGAAQRAALADPAGLARVLRLASRDGMREMGSKFDESWAFGQLQRVGRMRDPSTFAPSPRVNAPAAPAEPLSAAALELLRARWEERVARETGLADYAALRRALRDEVAARARASA